MLLKVNNISVSIANIKILSNISLDVSKFTSIIGRNGAGKTTLIRSIMKILEIEKGDVEFNKTRISDYETYAMTSFGIGYMPEDRRLIPNLTVKENILLPLWSKKKNKESNDLEVILNFIPEIKSFLKNGTPFFCGKRRL